jgi:hypothetical protein
MGGQMMKRNIYYIMLALAVSAASGCTKSFDDSQFQNRLDAVQQTIDKVKADLDIYNTQISSLQALAQASQAGASVKSVEEILENGVVAGYRILLDNGRNASDLQKLCAIPDYPARKTMEAARRFSSVFCEKAAALILETDYSIKTSFDDSERLLELLILQLAQEARNG